MKVTRPRRWKLRQGRNSWQWTKHAWLYSDLHQALKGKLWVLNRKDINFCVRRSPLQIIIQILLYVFVFLFHANDFSDCFFVAFMIMYSAVRFLIFPRGIALYKT